MQTNNKKPKVLLIHFSAPPIISGVDVMMRDQARMFRLFGFKVDIMAGTGKHFRKDIPLHIIKRISPRHPKIIQIRQDLEKGIVPPAFYQLEKQLYRTIKDYITNHNITICILHNIMIRHYNLPLTAALTRLVGDLPSVRFIAWVHDTLFSDNPTLMMTQTTLHAFPWNLLTDPVPNLTYVCVNEYTKTNLLETFDGKKPSQVVVINNAIDIPKFLGLSPMMRKFYEDIEAGSADLIGLVPVRAVPRKNLELALGITSEILAKGINFKLILTANVDYKRPEYLFYYNKLKDIVETLGIAAHVFFMEEYIQRYKIGKNPVAIPMSEIYRISDFLLLTSAMDGFGLPLLEAGSLRVPIFASDIAPYREIGTTNINYFSLTKSPREIARFILERMKKMPQAYFYRKVSSHYSLQRIFREQIVPLLLQDK